jgi:hypothetical protein
VLGEHPRVEAAGELGQRGDGLLESSAQVRQHRGCPGGVASSERLREPQVHREGHQVLLRAVVDVALDPPAGLVVGSHDALA